MKNVQGIDTINCSELSQLHQQCVGTVHESWHVCLIQRQNLCYFQCPVWKTKSW